MSVAPSSASTLHRIYVDFLGGLPSPPSDPTDPDCMKHALARLAELAAVPSIASRSLKSPMSFSLVSPGVGHSKDLSILMQGANTGFSPYPPDFRSERKYVGHLPTPLFLACSSIVPVFLYSRLFERTRGLFHRRSDSRLHVREGSLH